MCVNMKHPPFYPPQQSPLVLLMVSFSRLLSHHVTQLSISPPNICYTSPEKHGREFRPDRGEEAWCNHSDGHLLCQFEQSHFLNISNRVCPPVTLDRNRLCHIKKADTSENVWHKSSFCDCGLIPFWLPLAATVFHSFHPVRPTCVSH